MYSITGTAYGISFSDVEVVTSKQMAMDLDKQYNDLAKNYLHSNDTGFEIGFGFHQSVIKLENIVHSKVENLHKPIVKWFNFEDSRITNGNWSKEPHAEILLLFLRTLVICHTGIAELIEETDSFKSLIIKQHHQMKELSLLHQENLNSSSVKGLNQAFLCVKDILSLQDTLKGQKVYLYYCCPVLDPLIDT